MMVPAPKEPLLLPPPVWEKLSVVGNNTTPVLEVVFVTVGLAVG
jgi:hypothetical protein